VLDGREHVKSLGLCVCLGRGLVDLCLGCVRRLRHHSHFEDFNWLQEAEQFLSGPSPASNKESLVAPLPTPRLPSSTHEPPILNNNICNKEMPALSWIHLTQKMPVYSDRKSKILPAATRQDVHHC